ncbi:unnamed protein product [Caenorhabditis nigoni]|uniref:Uncharacterized protein n=1 Tax=Caenorhabditis nigoni TaxID=1611254 RepID=A0A2G5TSS9_9PELO|nr:hypothetical protein B9Z55_021494 [Caenorhabditis nigoni]
MPDPTADANGPTNFRCHNSQLQQPPNRGNGWCKPFLLSTEPISYQRNPSWWIGRWPTPTADVKKTQIRFLTQSIN